jgi:hypothetical protein
MATKLEKNITRESTVQIDGRDVMVTLTADQEISFKLKGMRSGELKINIEDLYHQLAGTTPEGAKEEKPKNTGGLAIRTDQPKAGSKNNPMISLHDLRSQNAISGLDVPTLAKFDGIIKNLIDEMNWKPKLKKK